MAAAPHDVPRAHALAGERALDARPRERLEQHAVELAVAAHLHGAGRRAERRHDAGEHAVAFLPVEARHVERDARLLAVRRPPLELDVGLRLVAAQLSSRRIHSRIERVDHMPGDRQVAERELRIERARLLGEASSSSATRAAGSSRVIGVHVGGRRNRDLAIAAFARTTCPAATRGDFARWRGRTSAVPAFRESP